MFINPTDLPPTERYKLGIGSVVPRPIAWVSTMDAAGRLNLAPFSYFTIACSDPLTLLFCPQIARDGQAKDTLHNVKAIPEFVVNLTNETTAEAMNRSATALPPGESEFEWAGVTPAASQSIRVPRVAEAPLAFECRLTQIVTVNDQPGGGVVVLGEVQQVYIDDALYVDGYVLLEKLRPIGRLAGSDYCRVNDLFSMTRPPAPQRN